MEALGHADNSQIIAVIIGVAIIQKLEGGMRYTIGNTLSSKSPISLKARAASMQSAGESYVDCVTKVYQTAKAACESCMRYLCDFTHVVIQIC